MSNQEQKAPWVVLTEEQLATCNNFRAKIEEKVEHINGGESALNYANALKIVIELEANLRNKLDR